MRHLGTFERPEEAALCYARHIGAERAAAKAAANGEAPAAAAPRPPPPAAAKKRRVERKSAGDAGPLRKDDQAALEEAQEAAEDVHGHEGLEGSAEERVAKHLHPLVERFLRGAAKRAARRAAKRAARRAARRAAKRAGSQMMAAGPG
jgi:hypothetical protein